MNVRACVVLMCAVTAAGGGCIARTPADPSRYVVESSAYTVPESDWPARAVVSFPIGSIVAAAAEPGGLGGDRATEISSVEISRPVTFTIPGGDGRAWLRAVQLGGAMRALGSTGKGTLTEVMPPPPGPGVEKTAWSRLLLFFSAGEYGDLPYESLRLKREREARAGATSSKPGTESGPGSGSGGGGEAPLESSLTVMRVYEPKLSAGDTARGLIVHVTGIRGLDPEEYIPETFTRRGWWVLSVPPPSKALERDTAKNWSGLKGMARSDGIEPAAERLARMTDWGLAEWAYATEAGLAYVDRTWPEATHRPTAAVACSMGAVAFPAIAARCPGRVRAAVLVGGGGSVLSIVHESDATGHRFDLKWDDGELTRDEWRALDERAQERTRLDPLRAAAGLRSIPVLQLHAAWDDIVPAASGERLFEALGRPERWTFAAGHLGMFIALPWVVDEIAEWVERATAGA